jgi:hypothetical protein
MLQLDLAVGRSRKKRGEERNGRDASGHAKVARARDTVPHASG